MGKEGSFRPTCKWALLASLIAERDALEWGVNALQRAALKTPGPRETLVWLVCGLVERVSKLCGLCMLCPSITVISELEKAPHPRGGSGGRGRTPFAPRDQTSWKVPPDHSLHISLLGLLSTLSRRHPYLGISLSEMPKAMFQLQMSSDDPLVEVYRLARR